MLNPPRERVYRVVLFGATGSGKSSIVNLLAGEKVANASDGAEACTKRAQWHPISVGGKKFRLWDTMGFKRPQLGAKGSNPLVPYEQAYTLLRNIPEGVDLILICARKDGINASLRSLFWLLDDLFFRNQAHVALILTHFDTRDEQWWDRNLRNGAFRGIRTESLLHACITTDQSSSHWTTSKRDLQTLLLDHVNTSQNPISLLPDLFLSDESRTFAKEGLRQHCMLSDSDATMLVERFGLPRQPICAILFGVAGVGKSSIINLLVGEPLAEVSSSTMRCTLESRSYLVNAGLHQFLIWDTVGLYGIGILRDIRGEAIENAARLVRDLHERGGVDLLIFCKVAGRPTSAELNGFRLFREFLCEGQVPIAFIITHLESLVSMDEWWMENGKDFLEICDLEPSAVAGHACITSLALGHPEDKKHQDKLRLSRQSVLNMLEDSISHTSIFDKSAETRVVSFLRKRIKGMVWANRRLSVKNIKDRCGLTDEEASDLYRLLYKQQISRAVPFDKGAEIRDMSLSREMVEGTIEVNQQLSAKNSKDHREVTDEEASDSYELLHDEETRDMSFSREMVEEMIRANPRFWQKRISVKNIKDHCGSTDEQANDIYNLLYKHWS